MTTCPLCRAQWRPNDIEPESEQDSNDIDIDEGILTMLEAAE